MVGRGLPHARGIPVITGSKSAASSKGRNSTLCSGAIVWDLSIYGCEISFCPFQEIGDHGDQCVFVVGVLL